MIRIQIEDFSVDDIVSQLNTGGAGAIVTFNGRVRNHSRDGMPVVAVSWEVYESMAYKTFEAIRAEAMKAFALQDAAIVHRQGRQNPDENLVLIVAVSSHRKESFHACEYIMDEIKKRAPLWKKEILANGGERWIEG